MPKADSEYRIGLYECEISPDKHVVQGKSLCKYYYERFTKDLVESNIIPNLKYIKRHGGDFKFPVLVVSWRLNLKMPDHLSKPPYKLTGSKVNLMETRESLGIAAKREIAPESKTCRVVIDEHSNIFQVNPNTDTI